MRTHSRRRTQGKRPVQWIASSASVLGLGIGYNPSGYVGFAQATLTQVELVAATATDNPVAVDRFTVMRVKGELLLQNTSAGATVAIVTVGISVVDVLNGTADIWNPQTNVEGAKSWMFLRNYMVSTTGAQQDTGVGDNTTWVPGGAHIDLKVKRILKPQQALVMAFQSASAVGVPVMHYSSAMRVLVAHAI